MTHRQLLIGGELDLPLLGTGVPLTSFFALAPALFLVLHGNVLVHLYLLARRVRRLDEAVQALPAEEQEQQRNLLSPFPFVEWRAGRETTWVMRGAFALVTWAMFIVLPLFLLLWVQLCALPYQDDYVSWSHFGLTPLHLALVAADLLLLWLVWPRLNQASGSWWEGIRELARGPISVVMLALSPVLTILLLCGSFLLWFDQRPDRLARVEPVAERVPWPQVLFDEEELNPPSYRHREPKQPTLAAYFDYRFSRLVVREQTLMRREPAPEILAQFRREAEKGKEEEAELRAYLDPEVSTPLSLAGRNLRGADLQRSKLYRANLEGADLRDAMLDGIDLRQARLYDSDFRGASLIRSMLQGITICHKESETESKCKAQLRGAVMKEARLRGAILLWAQLQGAILQGAQLQSAVLKKAQLRGAVIKEARLRGATLEGAELQGATLEGAQLQGATLEGAQLQGANLREAQLWQVDVNYDTDVSRADFSGATAAAMTIEELAELKEAMAAITDESWRNQVAKQLDERLSDPPEPWNSSALPEERRREVLVDDKTGPAILRLVGLDGSQPRIDQAKYDEILAGELQKLVCGSNNMWIPKGILWRMRSDSIIVTRPYGNGKSILQRKYSVPFRLVRPYIPNLAARLQSTCPDLIDQLDEDERKFLAEMAKRAPSQPAPAEAKSAPPAPTP